MSPKAGGIDFGTSNSSVGCWLDGEARLISFGNDGVSVPSAIFYSTESAENYFGKQAVAQYRSGEEGRLLRSLKSVLGSSLMKEKTTIRNQRVPFTDIIQDYFGFIRQAIAESTDTPVQQVVVGRPVHFVDDDEQKDRDAEQQLRSIAESAGFTHVEFQFEPIAAALNYENSLTREELALVVDIGGGTADFTLIRLSPDRHRSADRTADILSTVGIHIGGTDFDRLLSLQSVMPLLGRGSKVRGTGREVPGSIYFDLATWHRIPLLYNPATLTTIRQMKIDAVDREKVQRLEAVVSGQHGHELAGAVEQAKIQLSDAQSTRLSLTCVADGLVGDIRRCDFEQSIARSVDQLAGCINEGLTLAGLQPNHITSVFHTGGSSSVPLLQQRIHQMFPDAEQVQGDTFGSVGLGLTIDAGRRFA